MKTESLSGKMKTKNFMIQYMIVIIFIVLVVVLCFLAPGFCSLTNAINIIRQCSISGMLALALTYVLISGNVDLSTGGITCLTGMVAGMVSMYNVPLAIVAGIMTGIAAGVLNGSMVVFFKAQPFILTLGMSSAFRGLAMVVSNGNAVYDIPGDYLQIVEGDVAGIPVPVIIFVIVVVIAHIVLSNTKLGRYIYATGSNEEAARLSGVKVNVIKMTVFTISGFLCSLGGIMLTARTNTAQPVSAVGWELTAITSVIIGGTSLKGGRGGVLNTLIGVLLLAVIDTGMIQMKIDTNYQQLIKGIVIVLAVLLDSKKK
jgi:ribose/xylose/arabinose/galactoside ABC-type transport system permease subunit